MSLSGFEPNQIVLAYFFFKKFVYLEMLFVLAALRLILGHGRARILAFATVILCGLGIFATFAPAMNLTSSPLYGPVARSLAHGGGMTALLAASALFAVSGFVPSVRARFLDAAHVVLIACLLGLWLATLF